MGTHTVAVIAGIIDRHFEEAAFLWQLRQRTSVAPDWSLADLADFDERLEAHVDGLRAAGEYAWQTSAQALERGPNEVFVAALLAIESGHKERITRVIRAGLASPASHRGVASAFGYVAPRYLERLVRDLLASASPVGRQLGIAACTLHGVSPGAPLLQSIGDPDADVDIYAIRAVGILGLREHAVMMERSVNGGRADRQFWVSWSRVLLGYRDDALDALRRVAFDDGVHSRDAFRLMLQSMDLPTAHEVLQQIAEKPDYKRRLMEGSGIVGDPAYVPWLIRHMAKPETTRLAGEAFTLITGADLGKLQLWRPRPEDFESGPNDDRNDPNVDMDPDEGLRWPDQQKVEKWWAANSSRFRAGMRYFMGAPVTREHCIDVLKNGYQRQRILAAHYLCLLNPGTVLFNTSAPAWRQQRLLAQMQ